MRLSLFFLVFILILILSSGVAFACEVVVAVVDTGLDLQNSVIKKHLWVNKAEIPNNRVDDDNNGYIDDIHGWDFTSDSPWPEDRHGHGTHVTGIIISEIQKFRGEHDCEVLVMPLKYYGVKASQSNTLAHTVSALNYAVMMGVHIINYSGGGTYPSEPERRILKEADKRGVLLVAAAGNNGTNSDVQRFFPAGYALPNTLSVTATDSRGRILETSNFGWQTVHLAAAGKDISSWLSEGKRGTMTGTSQATAFVTAAAALLMARSPFLLRRPFEVIETLIASATPDDFLKTRAGSLNTQKSLHLQPSGVSALGIVADNVVSTDSKLLYVH